MVGLAGNRSKLWASLAVARQGCGRLLSAYRVPVELASTSTDATVWVKDAGIVDGPDGDRAERRQKMSLEDRLVALPGLRLERAPRLSPGRRPYLEWLPALAGVDPLAAKEVGLDAASEPDGIGLAVERALALAAGVVAVADVPSRLACGRAPPADVSHARASRPPTARDDRRLDPALAQPSIDLDRVEAHEAAEFQVRNAAVVDESPDKALRHAETRRQAVYVEQWCSLDARLSSHRHAIQLSSNRPFGTMLKELSPIAWYIRGTSPTSQALPVSSRKGL